MRIPLPFIVSNTCFRSRLRGVGLALLVASTASLSACLPRMVVVNGNEVPYDEGAELVYREAQDAMERGDRITAETRYKDLLQQFGDSDLVPYALDGLGKIVFEDGGCAASARYDRRLIGDFPRHPGAARAQQRQSGCETVAVEETMNQFTEAFDRAATPTEQLQVARSAADAAEQEGEYLQKIRWLLRMRGVASAPQAEIEAEVLEVIDGKLSATNLRVLADSLSGGEFPAARVNAKLALLLEHSGDRANAMAWYEKYLRSWPDGEFASVVRTRLNRLNAQTQVRPGTIGVLLPLSGRHRAVGKLALQAIRMGLGLRGRSNTTSYGARIVVADTKSDGVSAAEAVDKLVAEDGAQVLLGPIFTYESMPAAFRAQALGVPMLTISRADNLPDIGPYIFRNGVTNEDQVRALVAHAMDVMGMRNFAILYPRHPYGEELLHLFWDEVTKKGGEIRGVEAYNADATTFTSQVKRLVARRDLELRADYLTEKEKCEEQPDTYRVARCIERLRKAIQPLIDFEGLFIPHFPPRISMITAALAAEDIIVEQDPRRLEIIEKTLGRKVKPVTLLGANGWNSARVLERSGRNVENAVFTDGFFASAEQREVAEFVLEYRKLYQRTPRLYPEALFFDSARILRTVMTKKPATREDVRQALRLVRDFPGVTGKTTFSGTNVASRGIRVLQIKDGAIQEVPPVDAAPRVPRTN